MFIKRLLRNSLNKEKASISLIIGILLFIYLPLLLTLSLRNDQITYFLPVRMYLSDAFNRSEYMFWLPFMSGSYPIHSDMQGPVWNPLTVVLAYLFNYNAYTLAFELLSYIIIGSVGCFYFAQKFTARLDIPIIIAISYGCGGFITSIFEFMGWVGSFAFLPWASYFFYNFIKLGNFYSAAKLSISLVLLMVCGYPSFLIYFGYAMLISTVFYFSTVFFQNKAEKILPVIKYGIISFFLFILLGLPAIHSYYEYIPYYERGNRATNAQLNSETFHIHYILSVLFPGGGNFCHKNIYFGIIPLISVFIFFKTTKASARDYFIIAACIFTFLFTLGASTPIRMWSADHIPLLGKFGFSYSVRIFLTFAVYIWVIPGLQYLLSKPDAVTLKTIRKIILTLGAILLCYLIFSYGKINFLSPAAKGVFYISALWQIALLSILFHFHRQIFFHPKRLLLITIIDLTFAALSTAPLQGLSRTPPKTYDLFIEKFYQEEPYRLLTHPHLRDTSLLSINTYTEVNATKIIPRANFPSNTRLDTFYNYAMNSATHFTSMFSRPFIFTMEEASIEIEDLNVGYNKIFFRVKSSENCEIIIMQTPHFRWESLNRENTIKDYEGVFIKTSIKEGVSEVHLHYRISDLITEAILSIITLFVILIILIIEKRNRSKTINTLPH